MTDNKCSPETESVDAQFAADAVSDEDLIAEAPAIFRQLAAKLAQLLDDDCWNNIEPYLLDVARLLRGHAQASRGTADIAAERHRQVSKEGWTPEHDDEHTEQALASAALCYVHAAIFSPNDFIRRYWPWDQKWWKPTDARSNLVKAGALIAAEIDRLDRASSVSSTPHQTHCDGADDLEHLDGMLDDRERG